MATTTNKDRSKNQESKSTGLQNYDQSMATAEQAIDFIKNHINTEDPSPQVLAVMKEAIKFLPEVAEQIGNLAYQARETLIASCSKNTLIRECIHDKVTKLRNELGYEEAPTLENLLIEQVILCWLHMYSVESSYSNVMKGSVTLAQGTYWERRLTVTQGRYLRAMEMLARVRRLMRPVPLQVNIAAAGGQQINTVQATEAGEPGEAGKPWV